MIGRANFIAIFSLVESEICIVKTKQSLAPTGQSRHSAANGAMRTFDRIATLLLTYNTLGGKTNGLIPILPPDSHFNH